MRLPLKWAPHIILVICLSAIYLGTMAPGLTWANGGSDGGDLITAAATGGVAHPTGYPVYLLVAQAFQLLPVGSLAYRTNLLSAVAMVGAAVLVYEVVARSPAIGKGHSAWLAGLISAFTFGLAPLVWSQAVITEVYALQAFIIALILYLCMSTSSARRDRLCGLSLGLATGIHLTTTMLVPAVFLANATSKRSLESLTKPRISSWLQKWQIDGKSLLRQSAFLLTGSLVYLVLPLRARTQPPVNWGDPVTPQRFWWLVSGALYQNNLTGLTFSMLLNRIWAWAALFLGQFGLIGLILGLTGLVLFFVSSRLYLLTLWTAIAFSVFAIFYASPDSDVYLIPAILSFAIWIGLGIGGLMNAVARYSVPVGSVIGMMFLVYLAVLSLSHWPQVDASHDQSAENFGREVMSKAPAHAILFTEGDAPVFALWYFQFALHQRLDVSVVADELLPFDWYRNTLRHVYPDLVLPESTSDVWQSSITKANPNLPVCYSYFQDFVLNCR